MSNHSFQYGNWLRVQVGGPNKDKGSWRNGIEILNNRTTSKEGDKGSKEGTRDDNDTTKQKGKEKAREWEENLASFSLMEKRSKLARE
ncbi:hypothetical protein Goarm_009962, partial [Gossypium armourianum]|nr:hypothetical protein [Gossypium armourianum]